MTDIVCKCGTSRLEDVQCAECGAYLRITDFNNWKEFDINKIECGKEYVFYFPSYSMTDKHYYFGRIYDGDLEFDVLDYQDRYSELAGTGFAPTHYFEITPQERE